MPTLTHLIKVCITIACANKRPRARPRTHTHTPTHKIKYTYDIVVGGLGGELALAAAGVELGREVHIERRVRVGQLRLQRRLTGPPFCLPPLSQLRAHNTP